MLAGLVAGGAGCNPRDGQSANTQAGSAPPVIATHPEYAGSASCEECHKAAYEEWRTSHHANAQRDLKPDIDNDVFAPRRDIRHGSQASYADTINGRYVLATQGPDGLVQEFTPKMALGVYPLWQYLIPFGGGRYQLTELAWDPAKREWFDVYGEEDRKAGEWGHWTGRGMNWNSMCGMCHTTAYQKNYHIADDTYKSAYVEQGVGCESCHGPMRKHAEWQRAHPGGGYFGDPTIRKLSPDEYLGVCGACHSRHGDLTGTFKPGDDYFDHYDPVLPDRSNIFYPDGQILDEDFEFNVFMLSYMQQAGVRCSTCHSPHTSKIRKPLNDLCLDCHRGSMGGRIVIDPLAHGFHPLDKAGSKCTDCHYPQTPYMQRHWRHDHGMTIPDPLLTKEQGIPNACTRCHQDKSVDWAIEWCDKWYGERMNRPTRARARLLARLKKSDESAAAGVIDLLAAEKNQAWRAVYLKMLAPLVTEAADPALRERVRQAMLDRLNDPSPLPQAAAIEALDPVVTTVPAVAERLRPKLRAPWRLVRAKAAWALHTQIDLQSPAGLELSQMMRYSLDQPGGAFRWANYLVSTGQPDKSLSWYDKAIRWDPHSPPFRYQYAVALSQMHSPDKALEQLAAAAKADPKESLYPYSMGLAYAEMGRLTEARDAIRRAIELAPERARYWYNLALAEDQVGDQEAAFAALDKAQGLDPQNADYAYVRATIYLRLQDIDRARQALEEALRINPDHAAAKELLKQF